MVGRQERGGGKGEGWEGMLKVRKRDTRGFRGPRAGHKMVSSFAGGTQEGGYNNSGWLWAQMQCTRAGAVCGITGCCDEPLPLKLTARSQSAGIIGASGNGARVVNRRH